MSKKVRKLTSVLDILVDHDENVDKAQKQLDAAIQTRNEAYWDYLGIAPGDKAGLIQTVLMIRKIMDMK